MQERVMPIPKKELYLAGDTTPQIQHKCREKGHPLHAAGDLGEECLPTGYQLGEKDHSSPAQCFHPVDFNYGRLHTHRWVNKKGSAGR